MLLLLHFCVGGWGGGEKQMKIASCLFAGGFCLGSVCVVLVVVDSRCEAGWFTGGTLADHSLSWLRDRWWLGHHRQYNI